jgi:Uncharacterized enzyme involved in pigment biosynthesis
MSTLGEYLRIHCEVRNAIESNIPVVALESTYMSHGMPYPQNIDTAVALSSIIAKNGAVPATIAIIKGKLKIGVSFDELETLCKDRNVIKISKRDIPYAVKVGINGATTAAATMFIASMARIRIFSTGGIGGVQKNGTNTFDISADLTELTKTNLAVICSGIKPVLDMGLTLEKLDTLEIPVIGYKTTNFPGYYTRKSGYRTVCSLNSSQEIAEALKIKWDLGIDGGTIIVNPIHSEYELDESLINEAVERAISTAREKKISGKELTPFLISSLNVLTGGESLKANMAIVKSNAELASKIATDLERIDTPRLSLDRQVIF